MSWVKIDDQFADHPKFILNRDLGSIAQLIQVRALCYSCRHLTDGLIPLRIIPVLLAGLEHVGIDEGGVPGLCAVGKNVPEYDWPALMVEFCLWEKEGEDFRIHDFLDYNESRDAILRRRAEKVAGGKKGAQSRWMARPMAHAMGQPMPDPMPVRHAPDPDPLPLPQDQKQPPPIPPTGGAGSVSFESVWKLYPKHRRVRKRVALKLWRERKLEAQAEQIIERLKIWLQSRDWTKDSGKYVPALPKFLREWRWEDLPERASNQPDRWATIRELSNDEEDFERMKNEILEREARAHGT